VRFALVAILLAGCAGTHGCYVGFSLIPPSPVVMCGIDWTPKELMFDRILDWIDRGWAHLKPFFVVDAFEKAGVLRFGQYHRSAEPGFHWKIPFVDEPSRSPRA
jgi:hypothetical protein